MNRLHQKIETYLYQKGFKHPQVRRVMLVQVYVALAMCLAGLVLGGLTAWPLFLAVGTLMATWNFYHLARFASQLVYATYSRQMLFGLIIRFYGRLILTGLALAALIHWGGASLYALLAGLSSVVLTIVCWGGAQMAGLNIKEA